MGLISGTSTVTVQAKLTEAGKKKIFDSIENTDSGFITKFTIGDSDANYEAIQAGTPPLIPGHVPEVSEFVPHIRSFALYTGSYRPGIPIVLVNNEYGSDNGITVEMSIGANEQATIIFTPSTEWPKNESFTEYHKLVMQNPGNLSEEALHRLFAAAGPLTNGQYAFQFHGGASNQELETLVGTSGSGNFTIIPIQVIGRTTNAVLMYNIRLVY